MTGVKVPAPVPAPRRSRSRDPMDSSTPSAPERRKKKAAPPPPASMGGTAHRVRYPISEFLNYNPSEFAGD